MDTNLSILKSSPFFQALPAGRIYTKFTRNYFYGIYTAAKDSLEQQIQSSLTFSRFINRFHAYVIIIAISSQSYTPFPKKPVLYHV